MGTLTQFCFFFFVVEQVPSGALVETFVVCTSYCCCIIIVEDWVCVCGVWWTCEFESHEPSTSGINMVSLQYHMGAIRIRIVQQIYIYIYIYQGSINIPTHPSSNSLLECVKQNPIQTSSKLSIKFPLNIKIRVKDFIITITHFTTFVIRSFLIIYIYIFIFILFLILKLGV